VTERRVQKKASSWNPLVRTRPYPARSLALPSFPFRVYVFAEDEPGCAALMAAEGRGASALERTSVVRGDAWSAVRLAQDGEGRLAVPDAPAFQVRALA
jgi:hypothetical protein